MTADFILSALLCASGLSITGVYFVFGCDEASKRSAWWNRFETEEGVRRRRRRRHFGMIILATVSVAVFAGINSMNPLHFPLQFAAYWLIVLLLILWLCVLGACDIHQTLQLQRRLRRQRRSAMLDAYLSAYDRARPVHQRGE